MIGNKDWLFDFDSSFRDSVKLGNDAKMSVMGKGNVKLFINGKIHVISNVYYLPGLNTNLLSVGQLQQKNVTLVFRNDTCKAYHEDNGLIFSTQMTTNRMYIIIAPVIIPMCLKVSKQDKTQLWHNRYGHLSLNGLKLLAKRNMVQGLPDLSAMENKCTDCISGKQQRDAIPKQAKWRASEKLQLIHSDICGPINPISNGGKRYFITFTDDYCRKTWVYFMKEKSEAFATFKTYKALVENESGCMIKCLRTDRGGEYTSNEFSDFCNIHGIKRQLTTAYTPQQNGVSERKNRTLLNIVRSMLTCKNVPKKFWPEALKWATYVLNRSPTVSVKNITPEESWSGIKPSVHHFRVFGCLAYAHIPDNHRKKLDSKSIKCVHLGLSEESKAYKLYDPIEKKIIISRDVVFDELHGWDWDNKNEKRTHSTNIDDVSDDELTGNTQQDDNDGQDENESTDAEEHSEDSNDDNDDQLPPRARRIPGHLKDFVLNDEAEEDQELHNYAVYSNCEDPNSYDEAAKSEVWRSAMNSEIDSI
jgi:transposase InsO family protein